MAAAGHRVPYLLSGRGAAIDGDSAAAAASSAASSRSCVLNNITPKSTGRSPSIKAGNWKSSNKRRERSTAAIAPASSSSLALDPTVAELERLFSSPSHSPLAPVPLSGGPSGSPPCVEPSRGRPLRVVYQGVRGSYCQEAAAASFSGVPTTRLAAFPCTKMEDAFVALEDGDADRAVVPAENSLDGPIHRNLDLLLRHPRVEVTGELVLPVNHCLLVLPGTPLAALNGVASHPQALAHCRGRIADLGLEAMGVVNAADAARALAEGGVDPGTAVIGSRFAAQEFGLAVAEENLQGRTFLGGGNYTRFLQLALRSQGDRHPAAAGRRKATVAFSLEEGPSALHRAMRAFESHGLTVTRVDHRPNRSSPLRSAERAGAPAVFFDYVFILDVEDDEPAGGDSGLDSAVDRLRETCGFVRVLGAYACGSSS
ncbi:unnamed protein product [Spirodela intermedia]|uniref:Prephenate dehydratase domain-containing protein n=1 Tax=Spirodela intermedia TaxID=51605 RepID=A0A7I8KRT6_SPIIN|nr:unnamed protein product [Spirodela intermedia]